MTIKAILIMLGVWLALSVLLSIAWGRIVQAANKDYVPESEPVEEVPIFLRKQAD